jgi:hypothetical protein
MHLSDDNTKQHNIHSQNRDNFTKLLLCHEHAATSAHAPTKGLTQQQQTGQHQPIQYMRHVPAAEGTHHQQHT